jgi:hypothetical protein
MADRTEEILARVSRDPVLLRKLVEASDLEGQCVPVRRGGPLPPNEWIAAAQRQSVLCGELARAAASDADDPGEVAQWLTYNSRAVLRELKRRRSGRRLRLGRFRLEYVPPDGWSVAHEGHSGSQASVLLHPPATGWLAWLRQPRLDLLVFPYPEQGEPSEENFRRATLVNLAQRGARVEEEDMKVRHAERSHECGFRVGLFGRGTVVRFITLGHEVVVHWQIFFGAQSTHSAYLPEVDEFIDSLGLTLEM